MAKAKCPECGEMGECYYLGNSSITHNILDDYRFICPHCGLDKMETVDGGEVGGEERLTNCPFCRNDNLHHPGGDLTMPWAEKAARDARMEKAGLCPTCGQPIPERRKTDESCRSCGRPTRCYHEVYFAGGKRFHYFVRQCGNCSDSTSKIVSGRTFAGDWDPKNCPICDKPTDEHLDLAKTRADLAKERHREPKPEVRQEDAGLCPKCGKHKLTCEYLGYTVRNGHHYFTWDHNCPCGFHDGFSRSVSAGQEEEECLRPEHGPGKEGGCPGHCD